MKRVDIEARKMEIRAQQDAWIVKNVEKQFLACVQGMSSQFRNVR